jgi:phosphatidylglycerol:prolipoprotein diacylglycerol transferase
MAGLLLGYAYVRRLLRTPRLWAGNSPPMGLERVDDLLLYVTLAVILGGRLGQVLLYDPSYYMAHPAEVFQVWKGGMSFHGALIGSGAALILFARRYGVSARTVMDLCCAAVPFGLFFGRIANFINSEHWGRMTDAAVGMVFPNGGAVPRHPSQLYEAALEGLVMLVIMRIMTHSVLGLKRPGLVTGVWLVWYAIARTICEFFREPEQIHALNIEPSAFISSLRQIALMKRRRRARELRSHSPARYSACAEAQGADCGRGSVDGCRLHVAVPVG